MTDIAAHVRIFDPDPSDDLVTKRTAAIKELATRYSKSRPAPAILQDANDLTAAVEAKGHVSAAMGKDIEAAIRKAGAEAFVVEGQDLQVAVCGLLAALQVLEESEPTKGAVTTSAVLALGLWSALSFQMPRAEPKLEALRSAVMAAARDYVIAAASSSRQRAIVPDVEISAIDPWDAATTVKTINAALRGTINALKTNAAIDREEIDLLWWVLGDWSALLHQRYSAPANPISSALSSGIEAGRMLQRLPADAHRYLVLCHVKQSEILNLLELVKAVGEDHKLLAASFQNEDKVQSCPVVFPVLAALKTGSAAHARAAKTKRALTEWANRALLESATLHVTSLLPVEV